MPLLARYRVLVPDMPGFGDSDGPPEPHTADGLADLIAAALDAIVPPPTPLDLAGFSFGGIIGGLLAARLGPRISALALSRVERGMRETDVLRVHRENLRRLMLRIGNEDGPVAHPAS